MNAELMNQFILAADHVFNQVGNITLKKEKTELFPEGHKLQANVATILSITGALKGQIILSITEEIAMKAASAILMGMPVDEYNEMAESGICEMVNMIAGEASRRLHEMGYPCDLSVPTIIRGECVDIGFYPKTPLFLVKFSCDWGKIEMILRFSINNNSD